MIKLKYNRMNKLLYIIGMAFLLSTAANGQQKVSGIVKDGNGNPVNGAKVSLAGQESVNCVTDAEGFYSLPEVAEGDYLVVSYADNKVRRFQVAGSEMNILFDDVEAKMIDLGFAKKNSDNLTQSVSSVSSDVFASKTSTSLQNSLYGLLPGLYAKQNVGWHAEATLNVRGRGGLDSSSPLVIVDGFPRALNTITLEEVESVSVLKDGAATALYGARGANGVILVNTKRGIYNSFDVDINYRHGFTLPINKPEMADAYTYARAMNEALRYDGLLPQYSESDLAAFKNQTDSELYPNVDWVKEGTRNFGENNQLNLLVRGGGSKLRYMGLLDYKNDFGLLNEKYTEYSDRYKSQIRNYDMRLRMNIDVDLTPGTQMQFGIVGVLNEAKRPNDGISTIFNNLYKVPSAAFPVKTSNNVWGSNLYYKMNPLAAIADQGYYQTNWRKLEANMRITQDLSMVLKGLKAEAAVAYDNTATFWEDGSKSYRYEVLSYSDETGRVGTIYGDDSALNISNGGSSNSVSEQMIRTSWEVKLGYERAWNQHQFGATILYRQEMEETLGVNVARYRHSTMGIANYNFQNKYLVDVVANMYGTSVLLKGDKYRFYPAVSAAWVLSNESFLKEQTIIDLLKLRLSYGRSAVDNLSYGLGKHYWSGKGEYFFGDSNTKMGGYLERKLPMQSLDLETADKYNVGIDLQLLRNLSFTMDMYYDKRTNILVANNKISNMIGIDLPQQNIGKVESKGLELSLGWQDQVRDFRYYANANVSFLDSKVLEKGEAYQPYDYLYQKGHKVGQAFGLEAIGYFNDEEDIKSSPTHTFSTVRPGDVKYKDQNGDDRIDDYDVVAIGKSTTVPEMVYGLNLGFEYKGFGLDVTFQGVNGISTWLNTSHIYQPLRNNSNISTWYLKDRVRWTESTKEIANLPRLSTLDNANNYRNSTQWLENGSFLKLRNLNVYYTFPQRWTSKLRMDKLQVYVRAQDLFSLDHIKYLNCESLSLNYFDTMSISLGLNMNF